MSTTPTQPRRPPPPSTTRSNSLKETLVLNCRQSLHLTIKNLRLSLRNVLSTVAQLFIGLIFLLLLLIVQAVVVASYRSDPTYVDSPSRFVVESNFVPPMCLVPEEGCYAFAYGSASSTERNETAMRLVVEQTLSLLNESASSAAFSFPYPPLTMYEFPANFTLQDARDWAKRYPNRTKTIIVFENSHQWWASVNDDNSSLPDFRYVLMTNETRDCLALGALKCNNPWAEKHSHVMNSLHASFVRVFGRDGEKTREVKIVSSFSNFPHPTTNLVFDAMSEYGALFMYIALSFLWVVQCVFIVSEKESKLKEAMRLMGMTDFAYWSSHIGSALVISTLSVFLLMFFGYIIQFELFVETDGFLLLITLWLSAASFCAFGFFLSSLLATASAARTVCLVVFIITFVISPLLVENYFQNPTESYNDARWGISIIPFFSYFVAMGQLIEESAGSTKHGVSWSQRTDNILPFSPYNSSPTYWSIDSSLRWMIASFFIFTGLAWYLEQVVPTEGGRSLPLYFPLMPSYWGISRKSFSSSKPATNIAASSSADVAPPPAVTTPDVPVAGGGGGERELKSVA